MSRLSLTLILALTACAAYVATPSKATAPPAVPPAPQAVLAPQDPPQPVAGQDAPLSQAATVELVFVLDTTGSMSGLIQSAKDTIWSIVDSLASQKPRPEIRIGFVAFRDRGDQYVTLRAPLTADLDAAYASLLQLEAGGGGDGPESVQQALSEAVRKMNWSQDGRVYRAIFLVGDAPPHTDYEDDVPYATSLAEARERRIVVSTIRCGRDWETGERFREIASLGKGSLIEMPEVVARAESPLDEALAVLTTRLNATAMPYGTAGEQAAFRARLEAGSSVGAVAARAALLSRTGGQLTSGSGDLVDDLASGQVQLDEVPEAELPPALRGLDADARAATLRAAAAERANIQAQIAALVGQRDQWIRDDRQAKLERAERLSFSEEVDGFAVGQLRALGYVE